MDKLYKRKIEKIFNQIDKLASKGRDNLNEYKKYIDELIDKGDYSAFQECLQIFYKIDITDAQDVTFVKNNTWNEILFQTNTPFLTKLAKLYKQRKVYQQSYNIYSSDINITQVSLSNRLTSTYSTTGLTPSINISRSNEVLNLEIYDNNITQIQISKSDWVNDIPTNIETIQNIRATQSVYRTEIPTSYGREYLITTQQPQPSYQLYSYRLTISKDPLLGSITEVETFTPDTNYLVKNKQFSKIMGEKVYLLEVRKVGDNQVYTIDTEEDLSLSPDQNLLNRYNLALNILLA